MNKANLQLILVHLKKAIDVLEEDIQKLADSPERYSVLIQLDHVRLIFSQVQEATNKL